VLFGRSNFANDRFASSCDNHRPIINVGGPNNASDNIMPNSARKQCRVLSEVSLDGQTPLLVGHQSGAEKRWIEADRQSASGYVVRRRCSDCAVDRCRGFYSVGQPTMRIMASNKTLTMAPAATRMSQSDPI
jgi:hypothetical protein